MTDKQLEALLQLFDDRIQDIVDEYLQKMGRHIKDIGKLIPSDINRLIELKRMNANMAVIKRKIARAAERMERDLETVYAEAAKSDYRFQAEILNAQPPKDISENINLQRIILAQAQLTGETMRNIAQTTIGSEAYQQAIDRGIETVLSGITDYRTAVRRAVKEAAYEGLKLKYPSGYRMRLDSAVRMNVLDGVRAVSQMARDQAGRDFDADGVEISAHNLCAKDHLPYQGKQYANAEFDEIQRELPRPFGRWNCRHIWWYIRLGKTRPTYTKEQLEQFEKNSNESIAIDNKAMSRYQWTQEQRRIETAIRREKDAGIAAKANGDDKAVRDSKRNVKALMEYYQKISDEAGLTPKWERIYVDKEAVLRSRQKTTDGGLKNGAKSGIIDMKANTTRGMSNGARTSRLHILTEIEIESVKRDAKSLKIPLSVLRFNEGYSTGFVDSLGIITIRGDVLPDLSSHVLRDRLTQKAVLAHEYYGHYKSHPSKFDFDDWRDEFSASYKAAITAPGLSDNERRELMLDAFDRAKEAGVSAKFNKIARRYIYGEN